MAGSAWSWSSCGNIRVRGSSAPPDRMRPTRAHVNGLRCRTTEYAGRSMRLLVRDDLPRQAVAREAGEDVSVPAVLDLDLDRLGRAARDVVGRLQSQRVPAGGEFQ